eukprot:GHVR01042430.1.p1 GENE.GHVR01042430.1~~GHVR01042430.1.p1  ORF type:complete len:394 (-),score=42.22 GHVR01042430.1:543-1724(-)
MTKCFLVSILTIVFSIFIINFHTLHNVNNQKSIGASFLSYVSYENSFQINDLERNLELFEKLMEKQDQYCTELWWEQLHKLILVGVPGKILDTVTLPYQKNTVVWFRIEEGKLCCVPHIGLKPIKTKLQHARKLVNRLLDALNIEDDTWLSRVSGAEWLVQLDDCPKLWKGIPLRNNCKNSGECVILNERCAYDFSIEGNTTIGSTRVRDMWEISARNLILSSTGSNHKYDMEKALERYNDTLNMHNNWTTEEGTRPPQPSIIGYISTSTPQAPLLSVSSTQHTWDLPLLPYYTHNDKTEETLRSSIHEYNSGGGMSWDDKTNAFFFVGSYTDESRLRVACEGRLLDVKRAASGLPPLFKDVYVTHRDNAPCHTAALHLQSWVHGLTVSVSYY